MERDRKSPGLKELQGLIWEQGYQTGDLRGLVYEDVPPAMRRWKRMGIGVAIYSSGSELAQRRLFESTRHGDLTPLITAFFDTRAGAKVDAGSYHRIADALRCPADRILFVSDVTRELVAASAAGCVPRLIERPGNVVQPDADRFSVVTSLDEVLPERFGALP
jgi:enolase-phosphatase E1